MKSFKLCVSMFITASLLSSTAFAHLSLKDEVTATSPSAFYNWTGFYAGVNAGLVKHSMNITDNQATAFFATLQADSNPKFTGGLQIGYRRQLNLASTSGVYGAELSTNFSNASFSKDYGSPFALYQFNFNNELKNVTLLQLIGGLAVDRTLLFFAAGLSWTYITGNLTTLDGAPFFNSFNLNQRALGSALGGGIEYAFNDTLSARFKFDVISPKVYSASDDLGNNYQISNCIVQTTLGLNYKFA